jgi:hypothetical protein
MNKAQELQQCDIETEKPMNRILCFTIAALTGQSQGNDKRQHGDGANGAATKDQRKGKAGPDQTPNAAEGVR